MSKAFLYEGLTFECASSDALTIEGQSIPVVRVDEWFGTPRFPDLKAESISKLAQLLIDRSPEYKRRAEVKREHLAILGQGVEAWNDWRSRHPEIRPHFYQANLSQEHLLDNLKNHVIEPAVTKQLELAGR